MITAISNFNPKSQKNNFANKTKFSDRAPQIAFAANPLKLGKSLMGEEGRVYGKISKFEEETSGFIGRLFKKLTGKNELPFSENPLTANATLTHIGPDGIPIELPMPEVHTVVTKVLDGSNLLNPDAADLAANAADALSTKAALLDVLSGSNTLDAVANGLDAVSTKAGIADAVATGLDVVSTKSDIADAVTTGLDVVSTKADAIDAAHKVINGIATIIDKIL